MGATGTSAPGQERATIHGGMQRCSAASAAAASVVSAELPLNVLVWHHTGTPRMEYPENMIDGVRLRPTFNPYVRLTKAKRYVLDNWPSR